MDKRKVFLLLLVVASVAPLEHFAKAFPFPRRVFRRIFRGELGHIVGHLVLFGGLTVLMLIMFNLKQDARTAVLLGIGLLVVGLGQEYIQLHFKGRGFGWPEVFDLSIDLVGAVLGWLVYARLIPYRRYLQIAWFILCEG